MHVTRCRICKRLCRATGHLGDLRGADLSGFDLSSTNFFSSDLRGTDVRGSNFRVVSDGSADLYEQRFLDTVFDATTIDDAATAFRAALIPSLPG